MDPQICRGYLFAFYEAADRSFGLGERRPRLSDITPSLPISRAERRKRQEFALTGEASWKSTAFFEKIKDFLKNCDFFAKLKVNVRFFAYLM